MLNGLPRIKYLRRECPHCGTVVREADPASLRTRREKAGVRLRAFAGIAPKCSPTYVSDVELGKRRPTRKMVARYEALEPHGKASK